MVQVFGNSGLMISLQPLIDKTLIVLILVINVQNSQRETKHQCNIENSLHIISLYTNNMPNQHQITPSHNHLRAQHTKALSKNKLNHANWLDMKFCNLTSPFNIIHFSIGQFQCQIRQCRFICKTHFFLNFTQDVLKCLDYHDHKKLNNHIKIIDKHFLISQQLSALHKRGNCLLSYTVSFFQ